MQIVSVLKSEAEIKILDQLGVDVFLVQTEEFTRNQIAGFTIEEIQKISKVVHSFNKQIYISINIMIHEDIVESLDLFLSKCESMNIDGFVIFDFSVFPLLQKHHLESLCIYQPGSMNTNICDPWFFLKLGIKGVTISREITLEELIEISGTFEKIQYSFVGHGYLEMFYSRRPLLTNYYKYNQMSPLPIKNDKGYFLKEELRKEEEYPIIEDKFGTTIFRSKKLSSYQELGVISPYLTDFFMERVFMDDNEYYLAIEAYVKTEKQTEFFQHFGEKYDSGFFYRKTGRSKEDSL